MAWIKVIDEAESDGELRGLYDKYTEPWGGVDNILKIHSLNPASMAAHYKLYSTVMRGSPDLSRTQREMIALVVSSINHCVY